MASYYVMTLVVLTLKFCVTLSQSQSQNLILPVIVPPTVIGEKTIGMCPTKESIYSRLSVTKAEISELVKTAISPVDNSSGPPCSCGGTEGWTRVVSLNISDPNQQCPTGWTLQTTPVRGCGRTNQVAYTCDTAIFPVNGRSYSRVCGKVLAYQYGTPDAFWNALFTNSRTLDSAYVDGLSLTHGAAGSRQHIWTFAAAASEQDRTWGESVNCMCTNTNFPWTYTVPSYVGDNYFCDTGHGGTGYTFGVHYTDDPLWDGAGCGPSSTCCQFNNPPWFCTELPQPTTDDLELRMCHGEAASNEEDTIVFEVDINVA